MFVSVCVYMCVWSVYLTWVCDCTPVFCGRLCWYLCVWCVGVCVRYVYVGMSICGVGMCTCVMCGVNVCVGICVWSVYVRVSTWCEHSNCVHAIYIYIFVHVVTCVVMCVVCM